MQAPEQQRLITEEQIITPLIGVLNGAVPTYNPAEIPPSLKQSLDDLFPEQAYEEKDIQKAKEILGPLTKELSAQEIKDTVAEIQYLVESWLDDFERISFGGLTLKELLHEKGSL